MEKEIGGPVDKVVLRGVDRGQENGMMIWSMKAMMTIIPWKKEVSRVLVVKRVPVVKKAKDLEAKVSGQAARVDDLAARVDEDLAVGVGDLAARVDEDLAVGAGDLAVRVENRVVKARSS